MNENLEKKLNTGLTKKEVDERIERGLINGELKVRTKTYGQIVKQNALTLFNLINVILLAAIVYVGSWKNGLFFFVVLANFAIGVVQEVRAKKTIEKLSLIATPKANVLRDGTFQIIDTKDIVLGDIVQLKNGNQISADAVILDGECEVNESMITGESIPITKKKGDHIFSGSFLVSGRVIAETEHVGKDNYVNKITMGVKYERSTDSVIMRSVKMIIRTVGIALIPLSFLLIWNNFFRVDQDFVDAVVRTVAAISSMIPGGLVLLVSLVLAVSVVRLAQHKTLVQDLFCVENLARVDVLCLDKTGTITEGRMAVENIEVLKDHVLDNLIQDVSVEETKIEDPVHRAIYKFSINSTDENPTINAIRDYYDISSEMLEENLSKKQDGISFIPFSSEKKWSLAYFEDEKKSYVLGALEFVCPDYYEKQKEKVREFANRAKRVLVFAESSNKPEEKNLPEGLSPVGLIVIGDKIRENAKDTFDYFAREEVTLKVISGDDPLTVSKVALEAGLKYADKYIDMTGIDSYEEIEPLVEEYTIFGRVTPYQKRDIVKALQAHEHTVAMTGDGANDVLALREADCSIAMQAGAEAARNISDMVLLDSNFGSLPVVVGEGRKSINNLQRSASLYLTKTTYSFILAIWFIFITGMQYPFESVQVTLIGVITIGIPSFFLALEPNYERVKHHFLWNVFKVSIPTGIISVASFLVAVFFSTHVLGATGDQSSTCATVTAMIIGLCVIFDISGKMNLWKSCMIFGLLALGAVLSVFLPELFSFVPITGDMWLMIGIISAIFFILHAFFYRKIVPIIEDKREIQEQAEKLFKLDKEEKKSRKN